MKLFFACTLLLLQSTVGVLGYDREVSVENRVRGALVTRKAAKKSKATKSSGKKSAMEDPVYTRVEGLCLQDSQSSDCIEDSVGDSPLLGGIIFTDVSAVDTEFKPAKVCETYCNVVYEECRSYQVTFAPGRNICDFFGASDRIVVDTDVPECTTYTLEDPSSFEVRKTCSLEDPAFTTGFGCVILANGGTNVSDPVDQARALPCLGCIQNTIGTASCLRVQEDACNGTTVNGPCASVCAPSVCGDLLASSMLCFTAPKLKFEIVNGTAKPGFSCPHAIDGEFICPS